MMLAGDDDLKQLAQVLWQIIGQKYAVVVTSVNLPKCWNIESKIGRPLLMLKDTAIWNVLLLFTAICIFQGRDWDEMRHGVIGSLSPKGLILATCWFWKSLCSDLLCS